MYRLPMNIQKNSIACSAAVSGIVQLDYEVEGDNNFGIEDIDGNPLRSKQKKQKDISISIRKLTPHPDVLGHIDIG